MDSDLKTSTFESLLTDSLTTLKRFWKELWVMLSIGSGLLTYFYQLPNCVCHAFHSNYFTANLVYLHKVIHRNLFIYLVFNFIISIVEAG